MSTNSTGGEILLEPEAMDADSLFAAGMESAECCPGGGDGGGGGECASRTSCDTGQCNDGNPCTSDWCELNPSGGYQCAYQPVYPPGVCCTSGRCCTGQYQHCNNDCCEANEVCCDCECWAGRCCTTTKCAPVDGCCGTACLPPGYYCCNSDTGLKCVDGEPGVTREVCCGDHCCPPDESCCGSGCCESDEFCCQDQATCCPDGVQCCSDSCCPTGQKCCEGQCGVKGACCLFDTGSCTETTDVCCANQGGVYQGGGTTCTPADLCRPKCENCHSFGISFMECFHWANAQNEDPCRTDMCIWNELDTAGCTYYSHCRGPPNCDARALPPGPGSHEIVKYAIDSPCPAQTVDWFVFWTQYYGCGIGCFAVEHRSACETVNCSGPILSGPDPSGQKKLCGCP